MATINKMTISNEKGFALLAAIIASLILLAVGMLVINMATGDLIATSTIVGNKKALAAAESGIHQVIQDFNSDSSTWIVGANSYSDCANSSYNWRSIPGGTDANTKFAICTPVVSNMPPVPIPGSAMGEWGYMRYTVGVLGENTNYGSRAQIDIGVGYGPVPIK